MHQFPDGDSIAKQVLANLGRAVRKFVDPGGSGHPNSRGYKPPEWARSSYDPARRARNRARNKRQRLARRITRRASRR